MRTPLLLALCLAVGPLGGCADAVDPTLGTDEAFSLYGYLDPSADRQAIRVVPIVETLEADTARALDAVVTSVEPATGRRTTWRDSAVTYADGSVGHVYVADYAPTPGGRAVVTVTAADGRTATVDVEVPPLAVAEVGPMIEPTVTAAYPVTVRGVPRVIGGALRLHVTGVPGVEGETVLSVPLGRLAITAEGDAWTVRVPFLEVTRAYLQEARLFDRGLILIEAEFIAVVTNAAWAVPPGGFDLDAVVEPGTFSNVAGGFGFVGGAYRAPVRWRPSEQVQRLAGFATLGDPATDLAVNEIGPGYVELYNPTDIPIRIGGYRVSMADAASGVALADGTELQPGAFLRVAGPFAATGGLSAQLYSPDGVLLTRAYILETAEAWGAYPDGFSFPTGRTGADLFYGPVRPTPGMPNALVAVEAVINEVSTSGLPFVEAYTTPAYDAGRLTVATSPAALIEAPIRFVGALPFVYNAPAPPLELVGGDVVYLRLRDRIVDVRKVWATADGRSSGYVPDGPGGTWRDDLRRTRGGPNAVAD